MINTQANLAATGNQSNILLVFRSRLQKSNQRNKLPTNSNKRQANTLGKWSPAKLTTNAKIYRTGELLDAWYAISFTR